jgi:hypothetical protein
MNSSEFVAYVGVADFHDGEILGVSNNREHTSVRVRGYSGLEYEIQFDGVQALEEFEAEGMELYALAEMRSQPPLRRFEFANNNEEDHKSLTIVATEFRVHPLNKVIEPSPLVREYCERSGFSERVCLGGIDYLVESWRQTTDQIFKGYRGLFDEYLNDMDARRIINELMPITSESERTRIHDPLSVLDGYFREATQPCETCVWGDEWAAKHGYDPDRDWWYYRLPRILDFVEDRETWPIAKN